jgi:transcriptional regulator with XRE-family HTH domain
MASGQDERYTAALEAFTARLRATRIRAGLTQSQLAERARLSVTMVQNLERPSYASNPRLSTLLALAEALGVSLDDLLDVPTRR